MIINKAALAALFVAIKTAFNEGRSRVEPSWQQVATRVPSTTASETYAWLGQFPRLREWIGDRQLKSLAAHAYSIVNKKFESSVAIPADNLEDDTYGVFTPLFEEMGYAAATHPDELIYGLLKKGFEETCYDGQYFFDSDHPGVDADGNEVSVSNLQAGASAPWFLLDVRRPLKPLIFQERKSYAIKSMTEANDEGVFMRDEYRYGVDGRCNVGFGFWQQAFGSKADLTEANFDAAYDAMTSQYTEEGRPLGIMPSLLVVGPSNRKKGQEILKAARKANGETNTNEGLVELLVVPWLA